MKSITRFLLLGLLLGLACPAHANWGKTVGRLEVYLHHEYFPECRFPLTRGEPDLLITVDKNGKLIGPILPCRIPLNIQCGDCRITGLLLVYLVEATIKQVKGKKMLDFAFSVDAREARWECPGGFSFPLQTGDSLEDKSPFTIPWENDHILAVPGMMVHFILRVGEK